MDGSALKESDLDPYRGVVIVLLPDAIVCAVLVNVAGLQHSNPVLVTAALNPALLAGLLTGVATLQTMRPMKRVIRSR